MARHAALGQRTMRREVLRVCCGCAQVFIVIVEQSVLAQRSNDGGVEAAAQQIAELRASMANPGALLQTALPKAVRGCCRRNHDVQHRSVSAAATQRNHQLLHVRRSRRCMSDAACGRQCKLGSSTG